MAKHFHTSSHCNPNSLSVKVSETIQNNIRGGVILKTLAQKETFWISTFQATNVLGVNEELSPPLNFENCS